MADDWKTKAEGKRNAILNLSQGKWKIEKIPSHEERKDVTSAYVQQFLNPKKIEITEIDAVSIASKTATGEWSAVDVTEAFCHRAALAHQLVNCLHETFFDTALASAREVNDYLAKNKTTMGPLHGVPVSLKD